RVAVAGSGGGGARSAAPGPAATPPPSELATAAPRRSEAEPAARLPPVHARRDLGGSRGGSSRRDRRERDREAGAGPHLAGDADRPAEDLEQALDQVEAEADATPARPRDLAEHVEDVAERVGRDAAAGVAHADRELPRLRGFGRHGHAAGGGDTCRVLDDVSDHGLQLAGVGLDDRETGRGQYPEFHLRAA